MSWLHDGACRHEDPELFFPIGITGPALQQIEAAKRVCGRCDVVAACLDWALRTGQDAGVWGGLSETERRTLKYLQREQDGSHISTLTSRSRTVDLPPG